MPNPEEVSAWSFEEILAEVQALLPEGSRVTSAAKPEGYWVVVVERSTSEGVEEDFREVSPDRRMAALNVFGQVWAKSLPEPNASSPWKRRQDRPAPPRVFTGGSAVPDPGDLDPNEIASVYEKFRK